MWELDESRRLGRSGGFGDVFFGLSKSGEPVAIKRLKLSAREAAHREMRIADELINCNFTNVMTVLDAGEDKSLEQYFLVMPLAEKSLQDEINSRGKLPEREAQEILLQIAHGLAEVPGIVHRDLKPDNVLLHNQNWKIADFGIARFIEESTSFETLKDYMTAPYAAPEQWEQKTATNATDVYALGCIGYALLTASPPFSGPNREDYRRQHLEETPFQIEGISSSLQILLRCMLRKMQGSRIALFELERNLAGLVDNFGTMLSPAFQALANAGDRLAHLSALDESRQASIQAGLKNRKELAVEGGKILSEIFNQLADSILHLVPLARKLDYQIIIGTEQLDIQHPKELKDDVFCRSKWDVIQDTVITVCQREPKFIWGASLMHAKPLGETSYRWYEVIFWTVGAQRIDAYAANDLVQMDKAFASEPGKYGIAFGPEPIDQDKVSDFCERWIYIFAQAVDKKLAEPNRLPLPKNFWK